MKEEYISNQIDVYKNSKTLLELTDKLKVAPVNYYAHIHAVGEEESDGYKKTSLIGILMKDYSNGTGDKAINVTCNISPEECKYIFSRMKACVQNFEFKQEKIFGTEDENGYSSVTKLRIIRATEDSKGRKRNLPWYFEVENGKGKAMKNSTGGTYMAANSFVSTNKVYANLSDLDAFKLFAKADSYILAWEIGIGPSLITSAKKKLVEMRNSANKKAA